MDTIVIDDTPSTIIDLDAENSDDIVEILYVDDNKIQQKYYDRIVKESRVLWEFIEKCLEMEQSRGMERVIKRSLIPIYDQASKEFRESDVFKSLVTKAIRNLEKFPQWKFSHIKELCDNLKSKIRNYRKRKLQKLVENKVAKQKRNLEHKVRKKHNVTEIVLSDDSDSFEVPIVNLDDDNDQRKETDNEENNITKFLSEINKVITAVGEEPVGFLQIDDDNGRNAETAKTKNANDQDDELLAEELEILKILEGNCKDRSNEVTKVTADSSAVDNVILIADDGNSENTQVRSGLSDNITSSKNSQEDEVTEITENEENNEIMEIIDDEKENDTGNVILIADGKSENIQVKSGESENTAAVEIQHHRNGKNKVTENEVDNEIMEIIDDGKENDTGNVILIPDDGILENNTQVKADDNTVCLSDEDIAANVSVNSKINELDLLVPQKEEQYSGYDEMMILSRIKKIQEDIKSYKSRVEELEQMEVVNDTNDSPYILCENYKSKIVDLHKQLCKLTGENPIKRREVHLKAVDQRCLLPMKKLEDFINSNIGKDGLPHFPDFCDVVQCVKEANKEGNLGWNSQVVNREARMLFTHCGRALQQSRQRREWRHLLSLVKNELIEDPAESDPELMARLQANRRYANSREQELYDRYTEMDQLGPTMDGERSHFVKPYQDNRNQKSPTRNVCDDRNNKVRITPISVSHKVTRIVQRRNQIVEIVVSDDTCLNSDNIKNIIQIKASNEQSTSNEGALPVISGTFNFKNAVTLDQTNLDKRIELLQPKEEPKINSDEFSELTDSFFTNRSSIHAPPDTNKITSVLEQPTDEFTHISNSPLEFYLSATNQTLHLQPISYEDPTSKTKEILETPINFDCSNSFLQPLLSCNKTPAIYEPNNSKDDEISTSQNTNQSRENSPCYNKNSDEDGQLNEVSSSDNAVKHKTGLIIDSTDVLPTQNAQELLDKAVDVKKEFDPNQEVENEDETDATGSNKLPDTVNTDPSIDILAHFLKARVILPKMTIKFESEENKDQNNQPILNSDSSTSINPENMTDFGKKENSLPQEGNQEILIKEEPSVDIQKELDDLGDNFTMTIIDIEDPYLVVEISSDSSEDEEESDAHR